MLIDLNLKRLCTFPRVWSGSTGVQGLRALRDSWFPALWQPGFMTSRLHLPHSHPGGELYSSRILGFCIFQLKQRNKEPGAIENHHGKPGHSEEAQ